MTYIKLNHIPGMISVGHEFAQSKTEFEAAQLDIVAAA
jgi:hypothetical protein